MIPKAPHHFSRDSHTSERHGEFFAHRRHSFLSQAAEIWGAVIAGVVVAGGAAYSANQQQKAAEKANATMAENAKGVPTTKLGAPTLVNAREAQQFALGSNLSNLPKSFDLANQINNFQLGQALRGYNRVQPYFQQLQAQIGKNALEMSRGEIPTDVVNSIGRAAAQRGFSQGFGQGANGAGVGTNLGSLNLRNLGLTSLQTSQQGNQLGMALNAQAGALAPPLFDLSSTFVSPNMALAAQQFNAGAINQTNQLNAGYANAANAQNVGLQNALLQNATNNTLAASEASAKQYAAAAQTVAGLAYNQFNNNTNTNASPTATGYGYYGGGTGAGGTYTAGSNWQNKYV